MLSLLPFYIRQNNSIPKHQLEEFWSPYGSDSFRITTFIPQEVSFQPFFRVVLLHNFYRAFAKSVSLVN